ncbi:Dam family site-specific DNA-(adenine-N6)-methyltransferase [Thalassospira lucentensis]|uniref:DNA adenine methylase n=1 Tax=Thalassospira lucentensis TaxID=168935 RepID=UPI0029437BCA|nr:Dam family site-specific DNA-(adenine-N6)-methyltransferase [Thalassospira lucentensis]WOI09426.1 Dam family site-specific DNA-(adenine-N6)-methyltransferase [Thalassospira lucentensis]
MQLLKWAGSKMGSAREIMPYLDFDRPYYEPFCGSASFFLKSNPPAAILNDYNPALISFYANIRVNPKKVWDVYNDINIGEEDYYKVRDEFNILSCGIVKAGFFLYLNHYCFNGIYRTNKKGNFNTPFGAKLKIKKKISFEDVLFFSNKLRMAKLFSLDFEDFLRNSSPSGSTIYMDPPYFTKDARVFSEYGNKEFGGEDLERLRDVAVWCSKRENRVVISYRDCSEFRGLFSNWIVGSVNVRRNVGGFVGRRKKDNELIAVLGGRV